MFGKEKSETINLIKKAKEGDIEATSNLIEENKKFILAQAIKLHNKDSPYDIDDLCSEGAMGIMRAINEFDFERNTKFLTFAAYWIKNYMYAFIKKQNLIYIPEYLKRNNILNGSEPLKKIRKNTIDKTIAAQNSNIYSLDYINEENGNKDYSSYIRDSGATALPVEEKVLSTELSELISNSLNQLSQIEKEVITLRYGINGENAKTFTEIATLVNRTKSGIRKIEQRAIQKLSQNTTLREYVD